MVYGPKACPSLSLITMQMGPDMIPPPRALHQKSKITYNLPSKRCPHSVSWEQKELKKARRRASGLSSQAALGDGHSNNHNLIGAGEQG